MAGTHDFRISQDMDDWMREIEKRLQRQERRLGSASGATVTDQGIVKNVYDPFTGRVPTEVPQQVPQISVVGSEGGFTIVVRGDEIEVDPTSVIEYFVDDVLVATTRSQVLFQTTDSLGAPFAPETNYTFYIRLRNAVGVSAVSNVVIASLNSEISDEYIRGVIRAGIVMAGQIQVGNITIDPDNGIVIPQTSGETTYLRADGSGNQFAGQALLDAVDIFGNLNIKGFTNWINGLVTLGAGVTDPTLQPNVTSSYDQVSIGGAGLNRRGLSSSGTTWMTTDTYNNWSSNAQSWDKTTGAGGGYHTFPDSVVVIGVVNLGSNFYTLETFGYGDGTFSPDLWQLVKYDLSWNVVDVWPLSITTRLQYYPALGTDGTNLIIAWETTGNLLRIREYNTSLVQVGNTQVGVGWGRGTIASIDKTATGFSGSRYVVGSWQYGIYCYSSDGLNLTYQAADAWTAPAASNLRGMCFSGGNWHSFDGNTFTDHTLLTGTWDFAHSWVDSDAGGSGTAESLPSDIRTVTPTKYAKWTVTLPGPPPDDGTTDGANTAAIYAAPTGTSLVQQTVLAEGVYGATYTSLLTSGTPPQVISGFAGRTSTAQGRISSTSKDVDDDPIFDFQGGGTWKVGPMYGDDLDLGWDKRDEPTLWTPAWKNGVGGAGLAIGNGTLIGRYWVYGKRVWFELNMTRGSTTNVGTTTYAFGFPTGLPIDEAVAYIHPMSAGVWDASASRLYPCTAWRANSTEFYISGPDGLMIGNAGFNGIAWAASDQTSVNGTYLTP